MRKLIRIIPAIIILCALIASIIPACAAPHLYAGKRKKINCGILRISGATQPLNPFSDPTNSGVGDLFFLLEIRTDLKPAGWTLENPLAPGNAVDGFEKAPNSTRGAEYWHVDLSAVRDLSAMHILYLPASGTVTLNKLDREKLRKFVDGGGVLWIDNTSTTNCLDFDDTFFIQAFLFDKVVGGTTETPVNRHHPLISLPYWLSDGEASTLGYNWGKCYCKPGYSASATWGANQPISFDVLLPVVNSAMAIGGGATRWPSMAANSYGSGRIVATSNYVGRGCFAPFPYDQSNIKFAYNVMAWASSWTHMRKDPRHSGASIDTVGGTKLVKTWSFIQPPTSGMESAPVIYKNLVFYTSDDKLYALDIMPQEDLDQNGNPDDGLQDMGLPSSRGQDIVWSWSGSVAGSSSGLKLSSPTIVTAQDPKSPSNTIEAILVMSEDGNVYMLDAFPRNPATNEFLPTTDTVLPAGKPFWPSGSINDMPGSPLYVNGWIYVVNNTGQVHAYNPSMEAWVAQTNPTPVPPFTWTVPGAISKGTKAGATRSVLSYGLIRNENNGATVGMLYWFTDPWLLPAGGGSGGTSVTEQNDHICSIPIFVSNDRLKIEQTDATRKLLECRINYSGSITVAYPAPIAWIESSVGANVTACYPNEGLSGGARVPNKIGYMVVETDQSVPSDSVIFATYGIEYASPGANSVDPSVQALQPVSNSINKVPAFRISGTPSMSNDNMVFLSTTHAVATGADNGGSIFGIRNDSSSNVFKWIYYLHSGANVPFTSGTSGNIGTGTIGIPGVVMGKSSTGAPAPMRNCQPLAPPVVSGDKVIVAVTGDMMSDGPTAAIMCFKANPDFVIRITQNAGYGPDGKPIRVPKKLINPINNSRMSVKIWQPNLIMGYTGDTPSALTAVAVPREMIDFNRGTITFNEFSRLKLMDVAGGRLQTNTFSPSLPVWVFVDNIEVPIDFSTWSTVASSLSPAQNDAVDLSGWNNLLWYYALPEATTGISSAPVVIGNTIYFITNSGMLYALNAETGETEAGQTSQEPIWQEQVTSSGSGSFSNDTHTSIAGANGVLLVPAPDGLHAYSNATTLVTDSDRLVELDGAGEIGWSLDSIEWPVSPPASMNSAPPRRSGPVSKPASARYVASGNILLVNSGANQVCMIGRDGNVGLDRRGGKYFRWMFDKFVDPKGLLRSGQPTTLSSPTDALLWQEVESNGTTNVLMIHCLIADSGNNRVIDLVYRIDPAGVTQLLNDTPDPDSGYYLPELNWITKTDSTNERYVYNCIQLVPDGTGTNAGTNIWAAVSNYGTGTDFDASPGADEKGLGGAIVALKYRNPGGNSVKWDYSSADSGKIVAGCDRVTWSGAVKPLAGPKFFQILNQPGGTYLLICDNYGVYKAGPVGGTNPPSVVNALTDLDYRDCLRKLTNDYNGITINSNAGLGVPLQAASVQELPNGNWLIANSYSGTNIEGTNTFTGEVFEFDPAAPLDQPRIKWSSPSLSFTDDTAPYGNWLNWRQLLKNASIIQQPRSALRQF